MKRGKADMVNFIITAENPAGPWSDPIHIVDAGDKFRFIF